MLEGTTIDNIGLMVGSLGVILAVISILKGQKLEKQFEEKDKLKVLSKKIGKFIPSIGQIIEEIENPAIYDDLFFQLQLLGQDVVSKCYDEKEDTCFVTMEILIEKDADNEKLMIENKDHLIKCFNEGKCRGVRIECAVGNNSYDIIDFLFYNIKFLLEYTREIENEFREILIEFKPGILLNFKNCLEDLVDIIIDSSINSSEIEINIKSFNKTDEIGMWIYSKVIRNAEVMSKLNELGKSKDEIEKFREILITTSYS